MKNLLIFFFLFVGISVYTQGIDCDLAEPFCSSEAFVFPNNYTGSPAEVGPNYGCLDSVPNPAWYYLYIDTPGDLAFSISQISNSGQAIDVDFICYGPFVDPTAACQAQLTAPNIVACSFSPSSTENFILNNAQTGEFYIILITNYDGQQGSITFEQTNVNGAGAGSTDCSIVCTVTLPNDVDLCIDSNYTITTELGNQLMEDTATYTWYKDNVLLPETTATLQIFDNVPSAHTYRVEVNADVCDDVAIDEITINYVDPFVGLKLTDISLLDACDAIETNIAVFDLTINEAEIAGFNDPLDYNFHYFTNPDLTDEISNPENYETELDNQTIYVIIQPNQFSTCFETTFFEIFNHRAPRFEIDTSLQYFCENISGDQQTFQVIDPQDIYTYEWINSLGYVVSTTDTLTIGIADIYTLTATTTDGFNCTASKEVELVGVEPAVITDVIVLEYYVHENYSLEVVYEGNGFYEFALNDIDGPYQDEPKFVNLDAGIYTVYVREKNGCGISSKEVLVFGFPRFFSPNDDGINDVWTIKDLHFEQNAKVTVYDRFGRVLYMFYPAQNQAWNGVFKNKLLQPTDYWFTAEVLNRFGETILRKGHFSLIR